MAKRNTICQLLALMTMTLINKILLSIFGLLCTVSLSAQTLKGEVYNIEDSLPVEYANVVLVDSLDSVLIGTRTNINGEFILEVPQKSYCMKISALTEYAELRIINLSRIPKDSMLSLGELPMIKSPLEMDVQFEGVSENKQIKKQRELIEEYNSQVMMYEDTTVRVNNEPTELRVKRLKEKDSEKLSLVYILMFADINLKE